MDIQHTKLEIIATLHQHSINTLVQELATALAKNEALAAKIAELEQKLNPKPEPVAPETPPS